MGKNVLKGIGGGGVSPGMANGTGTDPPPAKIASAVDVSRSTATNWLPMKNTRSASWYVCHTRFSPPLARAIMRSTYAITCSNISMRPYAVIKGDLALGAMQYT